MRKLSHDVVIFVFLGILCCTFLMTMVQAQQTGSKQEGLIVGGCLITLGMRQTDVKARLNEVPDLELKPIDPSNSFIMRKDKGIIGSIIFKEGIVARISRDWEVSDTSTGVTFASSIYKAVSSLLGGSADGTNNSRCVVSTQKLVNPDNDVEFVTMSCPIDMHTSRVLQIGDSHLDGHSRSAQITEYLEVTTSGTR